MASRYTQYYLSQVGRGLGDVGPLYKTPIILQHGRGGIGNLFKGLFRYLRPSLFAGAKAVLKQTRDVGQNVLKDYGTKPISSLIKEHGHKAVQELAKKGVDKLFRMQGGSGQKRIKRQRGGNILQTLSTSKRRKKTKKKRSTSTRKKNSAHKQSGKGKLKNKIKKKSSKKKKERVLDIFDSKF